MGRVPVQEIKRLGSKWARNHLVVDLCFSYLAKFHLFHMCYGFAHTVLSMFVSCTLLVFWALGPVIILWCLVIPFSGVYLLSSKPF